MDKLPLPDIPGLSTYEVAVLLNVKTYKQYCRYIQDFLSKKCPFCDLDPKLNKVIDVRGESTNYEWRMWNNPFPQPHSATHLVIAPTRHIIYPNHMMAGDWCNLSLLLDSVVSYRESFGIGLPGGGILIRFGDPRLHAGSIAHIHVNVIVPDGTGEVRLPLYKKPEDVVEKHKVLHVWEKMRTGTSFESLSPADQELVKDRLG